jgi:hypothetical protein
MQKSIEERRKDYVAKLKEQHRKPKSERIPDSKIKDLKKRIETLNKWIREG